MCVPTHMCVGALGRQQRASTPPGAGVIIVSFLTWVLKAKPWSSVRVTSTLNHSIISAASQ